MSEIAAKNSGDLVGTDGDRGVYQEGALSAYSSTERDRLRALMDAGDASDADLDVLAIVSERCGLDPFLKEIYLVGRKTKTGGYRGEPERWETKWTVQSGIDGLRKVLFRAADSMGVECEIGRATYFDAEGAESRFWTKKMGDHPEAVEVQVTLGGRTGYGIATWDQFVQTTKDGKPNSMWRQLGPHMLAKCAKAQAIRDVCSLAAGIYIPEEMGQAENRYRAEARRIPQGREVARGATGLQAALESSAAAAAPVDAEAVELSEVADRAYNDLLAADSRVKLEKIVAEVTPNVSADELKLIQTRARELWVKLAPSSADGGAGES